jgi:hypothetical protein
MALPKIMPSRLQRVVGDIEFGTTFDSFESLCAAVAESQWAKQLDLTPQVIGALMVEHGTLTKVDKPESVDLPEDEPEPEPVKHPKTKAEKPEEEKVVKTYNEGGKGKKPCPSCKKYVGLRTSMCACGHVFQSKSVKADKVEPLMKSVSEDDERDYEPNDASPIIRHVSRGGTRVALHVPAGACPHRLESSEPEAVERWAEKCRRTFLSERNSWLTVHALQYFVKEFFPYSNIGKPGENPEHRQICRTLEAIYAND